MMETKQLCIPQTWAAILGVIGGLAIALMVYIAFQHRLYQGHPDVVTVYIESPEVAPDAETYYMSPSWVPGNTPWYRSSEGQAIVFLRGGSQYGLTPYVMSGHSGEIYGKPGIIELDLREVKNGEILVVRIDGKRNYQIWKIR